MASDEAPNLIDYKAKNAFAVGTTQTVFVCLASGFGLALIFSLLIRPRDEFLPPLHLCYQ